MPPGPVRSRLDREARRTVAAQPSGQGIQKLSMTRNSQQRRTPEQIRAGNKRLGLILLVVVIAFFTAAVIKQVWFS